MDLSEGKTLMIDTVSKKNTTKNHNCDINLEKNVSRVLGVPSKDYPMR